MPLPRSDPPQRVATSGGTGDQRITVSALPSGNQPPRNPHSSSSRAAGGARWAISKVCTIRVLWCSSRWPDVDSCIGGLVRLFWRWHVGAVACFGDGSCARYGSGNYAYAFPGHDGEFHTSPTLESIGIISRSVSGTATVPETGNCADMSSPEKSD